MAYGFLSSIKHNIGGAVINNPNGKIISDGNYTFHTCKHPVSGLTMIQIFGVHDPLNPVFKSEIVVEPGVSNIQTNKYDNLFLKDDFLFVTCEVSKTTSAGGALVIINVANKENPVIMATYTQATFAYLNRPTCVIADDTYLYVTSWNSSRLLVFDRSDLHNILMVASINTVVNPFTIAFYSSTHIVLTNNSTPSYVQFYDITTPSSITMASQIRVNQTQQNYIHGHTVLPLKKMVVEISNWISSHVVHNLKFTNINAPVWRSGLVGGGWDSGYLDYRAGTIVMLNDDDTNTQILYGYECGRFSNRISRFTIAPVTDAITFNTSTFDISGSVPNGTPAHLYKTNRNFLTFLLSNEIVLAGENILPPYPEWIFYLWPFAIFGDTVPLKNSLISTFGYTEFEEPDPRETFDFDYAKNLFCAQDKKKKTIQDLCDSFTDVLAETLPAIKALRDFRNLETSTGIVLDYNGALVGETRNGRNDTEFRDAIYFKISMLYSNGQPDAIILFFKSVAKPLTMRYIELYPAKILIEYTSAVIPPPYLYSMMKRLIAGGVGLQISWSNNNNPKFAFSEEDTPDDPTTLGFSEEGLEGGGEFLEAII